MRIGILGIRYPKGIGIIAEEYARLFESRGHQVYFLSYPLSHRKPCLTTGDWKRNNVTIIDTFQRSTVKISDDIMREWIVAKSIEVLFTIEQPNNLNTFSICKSLNIPTINFVDIEMFDPVLKDSYKDCTIFLSPTQLGYDKLFEYGIKNVALCKYCANPAHFPYKLRKVNSGENIELTHHSGWGGAEYKNYGGRKGTAATLEAFVKANLLNATLSIITQKRWKSYPQQVQAMAASRKNIKVFEVNDTQAVYNASAYKMGHVAIQNSLWEGLGMTYIEAMVSGMPTITTNALPMKEFVEHGKTGLLVDADIVSNDKVPIAIVKIDKLVEAIKYFANDTSNVEKMSVETEKFRNNFNNYNDSIVALFDRIGLRL